MGNHRIVTRKDSEEFQSKLGQLADSCREKGTLQELMVAMATIMQREMTGPQAARILPHAGGVDYIMRAVEHTLRGDPTMNFYVLQKLDAGVDCLNNWLSPKAAAA